MRDVNADGHPDLVVVFDTSRIKLHRGAKVAHLRGWLKNSQAFVGDDRVEVVDVEARDCRP